MSYLIRFTREPGCLGIGVNLGFGWFKLGIAWRLERPA